MHMKAGMPSQPLFDLAMFVGGVVVGDDMDVEISRALAINQLEKGQPFLMAVTRRQAGDQLAFEVLSAANRSLPRRRPFTVAPAAESGNKLTRFGPFSSQCCAGNVKILRGVWNEDLFRVLEGFPDLAHDDEVDACSGALEMLNPQMKGFYEFYRQKAEQLRAEQSGKPQPTQTIWAPGSMEWLAEQNKSS